MKTVDEIIAETREKYTVHNCSQCEFRKSCNDKFDSEKCKGMRQSIMLGFGIEDGYFTKLLDSLEAAHKREMADALDTGAFVEAAHNRERGATCEKSSQVQTMDKWSRPLTNVCKCGNNQEAKPCATVKDANGVVVLHFIGRPWRSPNDAVAMATDFCERVNNAESCKCGNMALMREALETVIKVGYPHNFQREAPHIRGYCYEITKAIEKCFAALSAPPRNCDVARDWLHDLYVKFKPPASVRREMPPEWVDAVMAFCCWLVKPVKEGGAE